MLFLYNLIGWEIQLAKEKAEKEGLERFRSMDDLVGLALHAKCTAGI